MFIKQPELSLQPRKEKFCSFLKSQIFYSIRAVNDIFSDSLVVLRFCPLLCFILRLDCRVFCLLFPLISSFLFQARIIPFFHFERHTKHKRQTKASPAFFCSISGDNIKRRHQKTLNIDTNSYDDSPTKSCAVGGNQREYWFFCLFTVVLVVREHRGRKKKSF